MAKTRLTFDPASETSSSAYEVELGCAYVFLVTADSEIEPWRSYWIGAGRLSPATRH